MICCLETKRVEVVKLGGEKEGMYIIAQDKNGKIIFIDPDKISTEQREKIMKYLNETQCLEAEVEGEEALQIKDSEGNIMETLPHDKPVCVNNPNGIETPKVLGATLNMTDKNVWKRVRRVKVGTQEPTTLDKLDENDVKDIISNRTKQPPGTIESYYQPHIGEEVKEEDWLKKHATDATKVYEVVPKSLQYIFKSFETNFKNTKDLGENSYEYVIIEEVPKKGGRKQTKHKKKSKTKKQSKRRKQKNQKK